jgi:hypothetical protein
LLWIKCFLVPDSDSAGSAIRETKTNYFLNQCKYSLNGLEAISTDWTQAVISEYWSMQWAVIGNVCEKIASAAGHARCGVSSLPPICHTLRLGNSDRQYKTDGKFSVPHLTWNPPRQYAAAASEVTEMS